MFGVQFFTPCKNSHYMNIKLIIVLVMSVCLSFSCNPDHKGSVATAPVHKLEGGWLASDGTVFVFRTDGTFHGIDLRFNEIWGNWVTLSDERIGFQSLLHASFYNPQYAIIDSADQNRMDYIVSDGDHFISAKRIPVEEANASIKTVVERSIHRPTKTE